MFNKLYRYIVNLIGLEMLMYLIFGVLTTIVNLSIYYVSNVILEISAGISTTIAFTIAVIFAYVTNKKYVFKSKSNNIKDYIVEMVKFISGRIFTYLIDLILMIILVDNLNYNSMLCKLLVNILVVILNYIISKLFVFKER